MALLILALLQRIFLMSSLMLLLVWLIFFMVLIKLLPILGRSEERFSRNAETEIYTLSLHDALPISHIGATAKDISNVVTDAASGVVDIFHGIDKAVADTWNNFWKDGKADGIGSNLSRK